ncbi:ParB/RepB/Spo0J family partition protein [Leifsonia sp. NPDC058292]|uniref:ParB/RepB/Spo0J family partition protein n=1 Tax=Leifsonia sp. NPDC058292 TaxID=3346428 RepID=UPI0036DE59DA
MAGKGKRLSLASLAGGPVESVPGSSRPTLVHLAPEQVAPTPLNPRQDFDPAKLEELGNSMRGGQLQPCVGIARSAYMRLFPEHADQVPPCQIVMAAGERRWKAASQVGLPSIDVHVREDIAESRVKFLAAVLAENVERSNFNYIEEARGLQQMLEMSDGSQADAARELNKSKQWFSQRIGLLRLSDEMQELVIKGEVTALRDLRKYSALPSDQQVASWRADREAAERKELEPEASPTPPLSPPAEVPAARPPAARDIGKDAEAYTAVYAPPAVPARGAAPEPAVREPGSGEAYTAVYGTEAQPEPTTTADSVPEPRAEQEQEGEPSVEGVGEQAEPKKRFPYDDGADAAWHLNAKMTDTEFLKMADLVAEDAKRRRAALSST